MKFGGTSLSCVENILRARDIVLADAERRFVVVSAPGKRFAGDTKVTDILIERFGALSRGLGLDLYDYMVSRGEDMMAVLFARLLGFRYLDAAKYIVINADGTPNLGATKRKFRGVDKNGRYVIGGFFGTTAGGPRPPDPLLGGFYGTFGGLVKTFDRGGSDTTGAVVAYAMGADLYEIFTDTYGVYDEDGRTISCMSFEEFGNMGLRKVLNDTNIRIDNTFDPGKSYTIICKNC